MATEWANPDGSTRNRSDQLPRMVVAMTHGPPIGTCAETGADAVYRLNPSFSLWLMGFPAEWASCGERATRWYRKLRRRS
jgi:hypothetical protein